MDGQLFLYDCSKKYRGYTLYNNLFAPPHPPKNGWSIPKYTIRI